MGLALTEVLGHAFGDTPRSMPGPDDACLPPGCGSRYRGRGAKESDFVFVFMFSATGYTRAERWANGLTLNDHDAPFICIRGTSQTLNRVLQPPTSLP